MVKLIFPQFPILLVDDEQAWLTSFSLVLQSAGINNIRTCDDSRRVLEMLAGAAYSVVLLDLTMPHMGGDELLPEILSRHPELPVIIITGMDTVEAAVRCMKLGAYDFFTKVSDEGRLVTGVRRAIEMALLKRENEALKAHYFDDTLKHPEAFAGIITRNRTMLSIFQYAEAISSTGEPVLITGETGVGKELIARAVHGLSGREGEFVAVNISGFDDTLLADTLFGHHRGAFSGAENARQGLVAKAANGSLFLDEIGDLSTSAQVKLLRLIQEREYYPLGSDTARSTNARMIFATHQKLEELQASGRFRQDLFYRLRTHHMHIPPLRERKDDLPLLLDHFLAAGAVKLGKEPPAYPRELPILLDTHDFPGNIRELESMVFNALSRHTSHMLGMQDFREHLSGHREAAGYEEGPQGEEATPFSILPTLPTLKEAGNMLIREALHRASGNQTIAAQMLGMTRQALNWRLRQAEAAREE